jgi:hypothetical protein
MRWQRLGHIFVGNGQYSWMSSHAAYPTAEHIRGDVFRIYFACRDQQQRSHIGFVDIDINRPQTILNLSQAPVLAPGPRGSFDDSGTIPSCLISIGDHTHLYYMGWVNGGNVLARNSIGVAIRDTGQDSFHKYSAAPIIDRNTIDPFNLTYSWVLPRPGGGYRLWYGSNLTWGNHDEEMQHVVRYAESDDAIHWQREGQIAINLEHPGECAVSRPTVVADSDALRMWYCWRGKRYLLGHAISEDGKNWRRLDGEAGLDPLSDGWEQDSISYPCVFDHKGQRFMLYNGGLYGAG